MKTRTEALKYGLSFPGTYQEAPFHDDNWQLVRVNTAMTSVVAENGYSSENNSRKKNVSDTIRNSDNSKNKVFLWTYERNGFMNLNVKTSTEWRDFWRSTYRSVLPGYHQNKEHWSTIILDGSIPDREIKRMIAESYDLVTDSPTKRIYEAVRKIPHGHVATYAQVAELAGNKRMSRAVGNALHHNPDPENIPCYRVVNSKGELSENFAFGGSSAQAKLLRADGVEVAEGKVNLLKYGIKV